MPFPPPPPPTPPPPHAEQRKDTATTPRSQTSIRPVILPLLLLCILPCTIATTPTTNEMTSTQLHSLSSPGNEPTFNYVPPDSEPSPSPRVSSRHNRTRKDPATSLSYNRNLLVNTLLVEFSNRFKKAFTPTSLRATIKFRKSTPTPSPSDEPSPSPTPSQSYNPFTLNRAVKPAHRPQRRRVRQGMADGVGSLREGVMVRRLGTASTATHIRFTVQFRWGQRVWQVRTAVRNALRQYNLASVYNGDKVVIRANKNGKWFLVFVPFRALFTAYAVWR